MAKIEHSQTQTTILGHPFLFSNSTTKIEEKENYSNYIYTTEWFDSFVNRKNKIIK